MASLERALTGGNQGKDPHYEINQKFVPSENKTPFSKTTIAAIIIQRSDSAACSL